MNYWLTDNRYVCWCFMSTRAPVFMISSSEGVEELTRRRRRERRGGNRCGAPRSQERETDERQTEARWEEWKGRNDRGSGKRVGERQGCGDVKRARDGETGRQREAVSICELLISRSFTILNWAWPEGSSHQWRGREREGGREGEKWRSCLTKKTCLRAGSSFYCSRWCFLTTGFYLVALPLCVLWWTPLISRQLNKKKKGFSLANAEHRFTVEHNAGAEEWWESENGLFQARRQLFILITAESSTGLPRLFHCSCAPVVYPPFFFLHTS